MDKSTKKAEVGNPALIATKMYEDFFVANIFKYWTPILLERANPQLGERVLDLACGTGVVTQAIAGMVGTNGKVFGLDRNPAMLELAWRKNSSHNLQISWEQGEAEKLPFPDQSFDLVTCQQGMQFFSDPFRAAKEMKRVLHPIGRVVVAVWQSIEKNPFHFEIYSKIARIMGFPFATVSQAYSLGKRDILSNVFHQAGFNQVKIEPVEHQVTFPDSKNYIQKAFLSVSAVVPAFVQFSDKLQSDLLAEVQKETAETTANYAQGSSLSFPMSANIVIAT